MISPPEIQEERTMTLRNLVRVKVTSPYGDRKTVLRAGDGTLRSRKLSRLLAGNVGVLVLVPEGGEIGRIQVHVDSDGGSHEAV